MNHFRTIARLLKVDKDDRNIVGYHATSVEAVLDLGQTGTLSGSEIGESGYLYFHPIQERFRRIRFYHQLEPLSEKDFWKAQRFYASTKGFMDYMVAQLGFHPEASLSNLSIPETTPGDHAGDLHLLFEEGARKGMSQESLEAMLLQARQRKGVHLGLSRKILKLPLELDPEDEISMKIRCEDGLPIDYIARIIKPASVRERAILKRYITENK